MEEFLCRKHLLWEYQQIILNQYLKWQAGGFLGTPVSSTNKTDCHDITELLLKVALNTITLYIRAHVGGWFGRRSCLVKVDFAFSLVKSEVQVAL